MPTRTDETRTGQRHPRKAGWLTVRNALHNANLSLLAAPGVRQVVELMLRARSPLAALLAGELLVEKARRVLAFTAHADDLEFFCGGTLRRLAQAGAFIEAVVLTDGEKGGNHRLLGLLRRHEARRAGRRLGYRRIHFVGLPDYGLPEDPRLLSTIRRFWQAARPDTLLAFEARGPEPFFSNRDHIALGNAIVRLAHTPPHASTAIYLYGTRHPNVVVDVTDTLRAKIDAVYDHQSQLRFLPENRYRPLVRLYGRLGRSGADIGFGEPFYRL